MDFEALVDRYIDVWNLDDGERRAAIDEVFTENCSYTDPTVLLTGRDALDRYIGTTRRRFRGTFSSIPGRVDGHHAQVRFGWICATPGNGPLISGFDVALFDGKRVSALYGFFE